MGETILTAGWLLTASVLDFRRRRIPVWLLALGGAAVIPAVLFECAGLPEEWWAVCRGCIPGILLLGMALVTRKAGVADGVAMLYMGLLLKEKCLAVFAFSLLLISLYSGILLVFRKAGRNTELPYLPFLTVAWVLERILLGG